MSNPKELLRTLLDTAISTPTGEIVNFQALRKLLEASIENCGESETDSDVKTPVDHGARSSIKAQTTEKSSKQTKPKSEVSVKSKLQIHQSSEKSPRQKGTKDSSNIKKSTTEQSSKQKTQKSNNQIEGDFLTLSFDSISEQTMKQVNQKSDSDIYDRKPELKQIEPVAAEEMKQNSVDDTNVNLIIAENDDQMSLTIKLPEGGVCADIDPVSIDAPKKSDDFKMSSKSSEKLRKTSDKIGVKSESGDEIIIDYVDLHAESREDMKFDVDDKSAGKIVDSASGSNSFHPDDETPLSEGTPRVGAGGSKAAPKANEKSSHGLRGKNERSSSSEGATTVGVDGRKSSSKGKEKSSNSLGDQRKRSSSTKPGSVKGTPEDRKNSARSFGDKKKRSSSSDGPSSTRASSGARGISKDKSKKRSSSSEDHSGARAGDGVKSVPKDKTQKRSPSKESRTNTKATIGARNASRVEAKKVSSSNDRARAPSTRSIPKVRMDESRTKKVFKQGVKLNFFDRMSVMARHELAKNATDSSDSSSRGKKSSTRLKKSGHISSDEHQKSHTKSMSQLMSHINVEKRSAIERRLEKFKDPDTLARNERFKKNQLLKFELRNSPWSLDLYRRHCGCNGLVNMNWCTCDADMCLNRNQTHNICFCPNSYVRGTDGIVYHSVCNCYE